MNSFHEIFDDKMKFRFSHNVSLWSNSNYIFKSHSALLHKVTYKKMMLLYCLNSYQFCVTLRPVPNPLHSRSTFQAVKRIKAFRAKIYWSASIAERFLVILFFQECTKCLMHNKTDRFESIVIELWEIDILFKYCSNIGVFLFKSLKSP